MAPTGILRSAAVLILLALPGSVSAPLAAPSSVLIPGVPFIPWREAAKVQPIERHLTNPSVAAAEAMIRAYWTLGQEERAPADVLLNCCKSTGTMRYDSAASFEDLKPLLATGHPVVVPLALTADGHQLVGAHFASHAMGLVKVTWPEGSYSRMIGKVMPIWAADSFRSFSLGHTPVREAAAAAERVVIGYDDTRRVVIVHDPSRGPAVEIPLDEFERMWAVADRIYGTMQATNPERVIDARAGALPYRSRTVEEKAAELWIRGTVRAALAMTDAAEEDLRAVLALPGLSPGYEHLAQLDLGALLVGARRYDEALLALRRAVELVPDNARGWELLASAAAGAGQRDLARDAAARAKKTGQAPITAALSQRLIQAIPSDVWLPYLGGARGWGVNPPGGLASEVPPRPMP